MHSSGTDYYARAAELRKGRSLNVTSQSLRHVWAFYCSVMLILRRSHIEWLTLVSDARLSTFDRTQEVDSIQ